MRAHGLPDAYERLKAFTRGKDITRESMQQFIAALAIPEAERQRLLALAPWSYTGKAAELAKRIWRRQILKQRLDRIAAGAVCSAD